MVTDSIKEKLKSIYKSNIDKVGVGFGFKIKDGQLTNEKSFTLIVKEKKPLSSLSNGEVFPKEITVDGVTYPTDVVAFAETEPYAFYCAGPNPDLSPTCWNWTTTPPPNRNYLRPLQGGISLGPSNIAGSGTLGLIAVDGETGCYVGLTNNHVVINDPFYTGDRQLNGGISNVTYPSGVGSAINAYQPGLSDPFVGSNFDRKFGVVLRYVPVFSSVFPVDGINVSDAAIVSIDQFDAQGNQTISTSGPNASWRQLGLSSITSPQPFATNLEINSLTPSDSIISAGRTSGGKEGVCSLKIHLLSVIYEYTQSMQGLQTPIIYQDLMSFVRYSPTGELCAFPGFKGDSGSAMFAQFGGTWKVIGLIQAGSPNKQPILSPNTTWYNTNTISIANYPPYIGFNPSGQWDMAGFTPASVGGASWPYMFGCKITNIASQLNIQAWDGTPKCYIDPTPHTVTACGKSFNPTVVCSGDTYWQVGLTNDPSLLNPCNP